MEKGVLLKLGEVIMQAYIADEITQDEQVEMLAYVNHFLLYDSIKDEDETRRQKILKEKTFKATI